MRDWVTEIATGIFLLGALLTALCVGGFFFQQYSNPGSVSLTEMSYECFYPIGGGTVAAIVIGLAGKEATGGR